MNSNCELQWASRNVYRWRTLTDEQRHEVLQFRRQHGLPWHSPPHYEADSATYLITAACYEHRPVIGNSPARMRSFEDELLVEVTQRDNLIFAWMILPNHYHFLVRAANIRGLLANLKLLHGRTSFRWNGEDGTRGRKVWAGIAETGMKSERHFQATLLYVLNNAVKHRYVDRWQEWPYSNAQQWLDCTGKEQATRLWREFPISEYGHDWDPADL